MLYKTKLLDWLTNQKIYLKYSTYTNSGTNTTYGTTNGGENCNNDAINIQNPYIVVNMWKIIS